MLKGSIKLFTVTCGVILLLGCASSNDVGVRSYVEVKDRVDQNMEVGNSGYVGGIPIREDRSNIRKTRKTYVVEVAKKETAQEPVVIEDNSDYVDSYDSDSYGESDNTIEISKDTAYQYDEDVYVEDDYDIASPLSSQEYTVQKDDTLQKISKKFYDSFSKWPKIYDANRAVIDNPDRIKPGIVIQIPSL